MIRLLRRIADTQLRKDNERLRRHKAVAVRIALQAGKQRDAYRAEMHRWQSIALDRGRQLDEMKEQNQ